MKALVWAAIDSLSCLLLVVLVAINPPVEPTAAAIETYGRWAVVVSWPASDNDVDIWLRTPAGDRVSWVTPRLAVAHLEQDDLGMRSDDPGAANRERVVIRSTEAGEYVANLHCYACYDPPIAVDVALWRLQGADRSVKRRRLVLGRNGQEVTVFRFTLAGDGALRNLSYLPARIVSR